MVEKVKEGKITLDEFWENWPFDHAANSSRFDRFLDFVLAKEQNNKKSAKRWAELYNDFLINATQVDIYTEMESVSPNLQKIYCFEVWKDDTQRYFYLDKLSLICNKWHFVRRYKNLHYAMSFINKMNNLTNKMNNKENCNINITNDIKEVMSWLLSDKTVVFRQGEGGMWGKVDPLKPQLSYEWEYTLAKNIESQWNINVNVKASCLEEAKEKALDLISHGEFGWSIENDK